MVTALSLLSSDWDLEGDQVHGLGVSVAELINKAQDGSGRLISKWGKSVFAGAASVLSAEILWWAKCKHNLLLW